MLRLIPGVTQGCDSVLVFTDICVSAGARGDRESSRAGAGHFCPATSPHLNESTTICASYNFIPVRKKENIQRLDYQKQVVAACTLCFLPLRIRMFESTGWISTKHEQGILTDQIQN